MKNKSMLFLQIVPFFVALFLFFIPSSALSFPPATPPKQPVSGPGGREYRHAEVTKKVYGEAGLEFWLFEPASPKPSSAPVIVFLHGWSAVNPKIYGAWIEHIVRRGNIVVYPRYQESLRTPPKDFTLNSIQAIKNALAELEKEGHVKPEAEKLALVGHSAGGQVAANIAALAGSLKLPQPKAVMSVEPGKSWNLAERVSILLEDLSKIPATTLLLAVAGDKDQIVRNIDAKKIFEGSSQVPAENKDFILVVSDDHGEPSLHATHFAPVAVNESYDSGEKIIGTLGFLQGRREAGIAKRQAAGEDSPEETSSRSVDPLDYFGFWKLFDGLCDAAFYGKNRTYALGNTPEQRFMGKWSDGTPVKELVVTDAP